MVKFALKQFQKDKSDLAVQLSVANNGSIKL